MPNDAGWEGALSVRIFITGGCKNGKSYYAQRIAAAQRRGGLYYIATMRSTGEEDDDRIARHRRERAGWGFETVEQPVDIGAVTERCDCTASFLLDSTTALLANEMFPPGAPFCPDAGETARRGLEAVLEKASDIVIVSDYIFSDAGDYDPWSEAFRRALAGLDRFLAARCDAVLEVSYSSVIFHKEGGADGFDLRRCISGEA